jgi:DNA-binding MarR family transcriptional regulator
MSGPARTRHGSSTNLPAAKVLATIRARGGCTIHEIATRLRVPDGTASARVRELTLQGRIRDSGTRRKNPHSGVRAIVWVAA